MTTTETKTLLEFLLDLLRDEDARAAFQENPEQALHDAGLEDVSVEDIKELLPVVLEHCHPSYAAHYEQHCDEYDDSDSSHDSDDDEDCDDDEDEDDGHHGGHGHGHHGSDTEFSKVITHLNAVTANYYISNDTIYENEFTTNIWNTGDGDVDFSQKIDLDQNSVSGDGGVLVDGDNNGAIAAGDGSSAVNGDGNAVSGAGSTTSFGSGDANSGDLTADNGSGLSFGGGAASGFQDNTDNSVDNSDQDNSTDNSDQDNSVDASLTDSGNDNSDNSTNDSGNDNSSTEFSFEDSSTTDNSSEDNDSIDTGDGSPVAVFDPAA